MPNYKWTARMTRPGSVGDVYESGFIRSNRASYTAEQAKADAKRELEANIWIGNKVQSISIETE